MTASRGSCPPGAGGALGPWPADAAGGSVGRGWVERGRAWWRAHGRDAFWSTLFPPRCVGCGRFETFLCPACRQALRPIGADRCRRCGQPGVTWSIPAWCAECVQHDLGFVSARSAYFYDGAARSLVTGLKYEGQRVLAPLMAALAAADLAETVAGIPGAVLTWVPTHGATQRRRGYNHAEIFARALSLAVDTPWIVPPARKVRRTRHQRGLDREARMRNLRGAFAPVPTLLGQEVKGIVLVDDVYTTGATASEAAAAIARATGVPVHVFTFCRTEADVQGGLR